MVLQRIILPDRTCDKKEMYYQAEMRLEQVNSNIMIPAKKGVSFFSYMNMCDLDTWKKYTVLSNVKFHVEVKGAGYLSLKTKTREKEQILSEHSFTGSNIAGWETYDYEISLEKTDGCCYFEIISETDMLIKDACFLSSENENQDVTLALNICTYHRNQAIERNIKQLRNSRFFVPEDELFKKLKVMVVDNGSELSEICEPYIKLAHNPNTGGSGGFKRGLEEIRKWDLDITHVVFMDDDVEFNMESLYRLCALLSFVRQEYQEECVAGRMFRLDNRSVQYTAAEIWNNGKLKHIGWNQDMTECEVLYDVNCNIDAQYSGWWFACYPISFIQNNEPIPFFLHCDDVEYGLRHGGNPIILNGIQVWHETYEYRDSDIVQYYDMRNTLFVNELYDKKYHNEKVLIEWKEQISRQHNEKNYIREYMLIRGLYDFCRGREWLYKIDSERLNKKLKNVKASRIRNAVMWRLSEYKYKKYLRNMMEETNE